MKNDSLLCRKMNQQLVVNWHILEECNFGCRYCFAHWPPPKENTQEIWKNSEFWQKLLSELWQLPNCVDGEWRSIRLNFAGGEPMLLWSKSLHEIMNYADNMGFALSVISNGYLITDEFIKMWAHKLQIIGISMDSANALINEKIGRCGKLGRQISIRRIAEIFQLARQYNPDIECKLNTVVNAENWQHDMQSAVSTIAPNRWKLFKMLPLADTQQITDKQTPLRVTDEQFQYFLDKHKKFGDMMAPENNDAMTESYLMVDPEGRLYQDEPDHSGYRHVVSSPIHEIGIKKAINQIVFDKQKFLDRYTQ